jgi:predicted nuclease of predicted toxin-antitoxin system
MKILIDMNLSPDWVEVFTAAEIESIHWLSIGDPAAKDTVLMTYAQTNDYVVFTNDLDFGTLLAIQQVNLPSVIQIRTQDLLPTSIGDVVISALQQFRSELTIGALVTIDSSRLRVRILPILKKIDRE